MVAYTQEYCLPYFEGTDSPCVDTGGVCAPSTVWCDMAARIDEAFTAFDETINRAVDSFPYAQVAVSDTPLIFDTGNSTGVNHLVLFDTVVGDSDGMVDLTIDPSTVNLRRSGIWNLHLILDWQALLAASVMQIDVINPGAPKISMTINQIFREWVEAVPSPDIFDATVLGVSSIVDMYYQVDVSTGPVPLQIQLTLSGPASDNVATVAVCQFSTRWVADLP